MFARLHSLFRSRDEVGKSTFRIPADPHAPWQPEEELLPLPRMVVLLIPKQPYVTWVQRSVPDGSMRNYSLTDSRRKDRMAFIAFGEAAIEKFGDGPASEFRRLRLDTDDFPRHPRRLALGANGARERIGFQHPGTLHFTI